MLKVGKVVVFNRLNIWQKMVLLVQKLCGEKKSKICFQLFNVYKQKLEGGGGTFFCGFSSSSQRAFN